ncbi:MAG: TetR/AcrR family transcriptional regulator [Ruminococcus bromii]|nr:TetR/AcrR family transcriptional regulator [Ruminococcus bromii]MEE0008590.1 TetR/AcrR family transcriptional regulator [Ruminococcus bromii]
MNKSESKYFNTAIRMDKAFLELLEKKDFAFITVKEICESAGVNRSTFYLHYETIEDLLSESTEFIYKQFVTHMNEEPSDFISKIDTCHLDELYLITPNYMTPYLEYVKEHRRLFRTVTEKADTFRLDLTYTKMFYHIFEPILKRFGVPESDRKYLMTFYIHGLNAIITEWLKSDCKDSIEYIISVMNKCIPSRKLP